MSAFNIDAANLEGQYKPRWGTSVASIDTWSKLGFSRQVLLEGATDPPYVVCEADSQ